jgi:ketosteroid isomerase-like protein
MRRTLALTGLGLFALLLAMGQHPRRMDGDELGRSRPEQEIRELEAEFSAAVVHGDRAFYNRVLAADFTHTSHSGVFKTRAEWLAEPRSGPGTARYDALEVDDLEVRVYGDTAVVTGRTTPKGRTARGEPMTGRYRFLRVWARQQGQWRAVAFQGTRCGSSEPPAFSPPGVERKGREP